MKRSKLEICKETRKIAADTLCIVLKSVLNSQKRISEVAFRDLWLKELRRYKNIFSNGWYDPPPFGIVVLFSSKRNFQRADFVNLRPKKYWPKENVYLDGNEGFAYLFASPVDKQTGLAGDFAINIYLGKDSEIINHLKRSLRICRDIFNFTTLNVTFSEIFQFTDNLIKKNGLRNNIFSVTDPQGINIGHTIPFSHENFSPEELKILKNAERDWGQLKNMISKKRRFVSIRETLKVKPEMVFTIEPALKSVSNEKIGMTMFHHSVIIKEDGEKELLTDFDDIFKLVGMDYMLQ